MLIRLISDLHVNIDIFRFGQFGAVGETGEGGEDNNGLQHGVNSLWGPF